MNIPRSLQELPGRWAQMCLKVRDFVCKELGVDIKGASLLIGASGGVDSTALICILSALTPGMDLRLGAAYLDHGLRPETGEEKRFVKEICTQGGIEFYFGASSIEIYARSRGMGIEDAARTIRYRYLEGLRKKKGFDYIVVAHQLNDLAEDVLLRLIRGSAWPSLGGMKAFSREKRIIRPLLMTPKEKLIDFLKELHIGWKEDPSNRELIYRRNRIRHCILPLFLQENPNFLQAIARLWRLAMLEERDIERKLKEMRAREKHLSQKIILPLNELETLSPSERLRWYKDVLDRMGRGQVVFENLLALEECVKEKRTGKKIQFPGGKVALVSRRGICFCPLK